MIDNGAKREAELISLAHGRNGIFAGVMIHNPKRITRRALRRLKQAGLIHFKKYRDGYALRETPAGRRAFWEIMKDAKY